MRYDTIIRNGRCFDGAGALSAVRNIGIDDGRVAVISPYHRADLMVRDGVPTAVLGAERTGSFLRAGQPTPAPAVVAHAG